MPTPSLPYLGFGLGLRSKHLEHILEHKPSVDWFEVISEDYMIEGGTPLEDLTRIRTDYPLIMHGVSMSIGSADPLNMEYLSLLKKTIERFEPTWVSDHLCWTGVKHYNTHDLLPLPYTSEMMDYLVERIHIVQDYLGRQILLENPSSYVTFCDSTISEWEFLAEIATRADCYILLDVNNVYVSSFNHGFDPQTYIQHMPKDRVQQIHLAGHQNEGDYIIDTHDNHVIDQVWSLYGQTIKQMGPVSTMIEWDANIPPFEVLYHEMMQAKSIAEEVLEQQALTVA